MNSSYHYHLIIIILLAIISLNLFIIDLKVFSPAYITLSDVSTVKPTLYPLSSDDTSLNTCPNSCVKLIDNIKIPVSTPIIGPTNTIITTGNNSAGTKEFFIPLGNGSTNKTNWEDITSTETTIDPGNYGIIKEAYFIASLKNPTQNGNSEAQIYNVTDKHPVWGSNVIMNGPLSQTINSDKISLADGAKLYRVQLKSTLGYDVLLENARIKIITE